MVKLIDISVMVFMIVGGVLFVALLAMAVVRLFAGLVDWVRDLRRERAEKRAEYEDSKMFAHPSVYIETEDFFIIADSVTGREIARLPADPSKDKRKANPEPKSDQPQ